MSFIRTGAQQQGSPCGNTHAVVLPEVHVCYTQAIYYKRYMPSCAHKPENQIDPLPTLRQLYLNEGDKILNIRRVVKVSVPIGL